MKRRTCLRAVKRPLHGCFEERSSLLACRSTPTVAGSSSRLAAEQSIRNNRLHACICRSSRQFVGKVHSIFYYLDLFHLGSEVPVGAAGTQLDYKSRVIVISKTFSFLVLPNFGGLLLGCIEAELKPNFATKHSFCSSFQALQALHIFCTVLGWKFNNVRQHFK